MTGPTNLKPRFFSAAEIFSDSAVFAGIGPLFWIGLPPAMGCSLIGDKLIVRASAPSGLVLRRLIVPIIELLAHAGRVPRLWNL